MKKEDISEALNDIDFDMVEDAYEKQVHTRAWRRWGALAACLLLIAGMIAAVPMFRTDAPQSDAPQSDDPQWVVPQWDTALFSAEEIAKLFSTNMLGSGTNAYTKVPVSHSKYLYVDEPTNKTYLNIYEIADTGKDLNEDELRTFADSILPRLSTALGVSLPQYEINASGSSSLGLNIRTDTYTISAYQFAAHNSLGFSTRSSSDRQICLNGVRLQIDQRLSDGQIILSLDTFKAKLFAALGVSFPNTKIIRDFDEYSPHGATDIEIYFYDESAHPLNTSVEIPVSDYIRISFDNYENHDGDIVSDDILHVAHISYNKKRADVNDTYPLVAKEKKISLEEAEALLYNGYVFGNHVCSSCMQQQALVSFEGYDFVGMEYVLGKPGSEYASMAIPFYVFYQHIGTATNGNSLYAKTYVAAIAVSGYEEYYKSQAGKH